MNQAQDVARAKAREQRRVKRHGVPRIVSEGWRETVRGGPRLRRLWVKRAGDGDPARGDRARGNVAPTVEGGDAA